MGKLVLVLERCVGTRTLWLSDSTLDGLEVQEEVSKETLDRNHLIHLGHLARSNELDRLEQRAIDGRDAPRSLLVLTVDAIRHHQGAGACFRSASHSNAVGEQQLAVHHRGCEVCSHVGDHGTIGSKQLCVADEQQASLSLAYTHTHRYE